MEKSSDKAAQEAVEREIAVRIKAEEQLWKDQKIEALGRLAGGIAHDFNNFLAVIMLHVDMLNLQIDADSPYRHRVSEIKEVSNNAAATVRQLMAFGRKSPMNPSAISLNHVIEGLSKKLGLQVGEDIKVEINLKPDLGICFVDANQIGQILMNLALYAKDELQNGGTLKIETSNVVLDTDDNQEAQLRGSYIQLAVSDNGIGLDAETKNHIFEPFFTTRKSSKGAGLSLASVYGIVKQAGGFIWVESEINRGTTFKVQFRRIDEPSVETEIKPVIIERTAAPTGSETILLVEDERAVRLITAEVLKISGYEVFEASNGMEALEFAQEYNKPIHLLLTDVSMPLMNGREVAEKVTNMHPETAVLFMSGNIGDAISAQEGSEDTNNYIGKPFSPLSLTLKVREILEF